MAIVWRISCVLTLLIISGCSVQKRAIKRVNWVDDRHPITLVRWCADNVPVRADTVLIPGREIVIPGTVVEVDCDTVTETVYNDRVVQVPCPPSTVRTDTAYITKVDSAAIMVIRHEKDSMQAQMIAVVNDLNRAKGAKSTWMWFAIVAGALLIAMAYLWGKGRLL